MSVKLSPAQQAWVTRRANGTAKPVAAEVAERDKTIESVMTIALATVDGLSQIIGSFSFVEKGKPVDLTRLSDDDKALLSIRLVAITDKPESGCVLIGYDRLQIHLIGGTASDYESIIPVAKRLDSVISTSRDDSEDSSFAMAVQAVSWNLRINWIDCDGKRSKRGAVYTTIETLTDSVLGLYGQG